MSITDSDPARGFYAPPDVVTGDSAFIAAPQRKCPFCPHEADAHETRSGPSGARYIHCVEMGCRCEYVA